MFQGDASVSLAVVFRGRVRQLGAVVHPICVDVSVAGWPPSLLEVYQEHRLGLVRAAALIVGSRELAEEAVHDAVLAVRLHWDRVDQPAAYLRTAVMNRSREIARRVPPSEMMPADGAVPEDLIDLQRALMILPIRQREAIVLRYVVGLSDEEIGAHLSCPRSTVRTLVGRAVRALREVLE